jgi:hypothetical protein
MSEPAFRIKPLEWEEKQGTWWQHARQISYEAGTVDGRCVLHPPTPGKRDKWTLEYFPNSGPGSFVRDFDTREQAEAYAYEECVMDYLRGWVEQVT